MSEDARERRARDAAARLARLMESDQAQRLLVHAAALEFLAWHLDAYRSGDECEPISLRERKLLLAALAVGLLVALVLMALILRMRRGAGPGSCAEPA